MMCAMSERRIPMPHRPVRDPGRLRKIDRDTNDEIARHSAAGFLFDAGGVRSFARQAGEGADVVLLHGVPTSSFLYRKVLPVLADEGMRATAFDFPGLGLAERPEGFDYSWSGLATWTGAAIDTLGLDRVHLVVHDIGGPIGFEWAIRNPDRVLSMTVLNTLVDVASFRRPWPMHPFSIPGSARSGCGRRRGSCSRRSSTASGSPNVPVSPAPRSTRTSRCCGSATGAGLS